MLYSSESPIRMNTKCPTCTAVAGFEEQSSASHDSNSNNVEINRELVNNNPTTASQTLSSFAEDEDQNNSVIEQTIETTTLIAAAEPEGQEILTVAELSSAMLALGFPEDMVNSLVDGLGVGEKDGDGEDDGMEEKEDHHCIL